MVVLGALFMASQACGAPTGLEFTELPPIPNAIGFAGPFAGVAAGRLVVAGGTNFPGKPIWEGGKKVWYDEIYVLDRPKGNWKTLTAKLPRPLAYGVSTSWRDCLILIGGSDENRHYADVMRLRLRGDKANIERLPSLPLPCAMMCGARVGSTIYVAGGLETPDATRAMHTFWALDLADESAGLKWQQLEAWPGPERHCAIAGDAEHAFYLASGIRLEAGPDGKQKQVVPYLTDAYCYQPEADAASDDDGQTASKGRGSWRKLADLPRAIAAAASPAMTLDQEILVMSGIDHTGLALNPRKYPPFPRDIFSLDTTSDRWTRRGEMPAGSSRVTAGATMWRGGYVIACGETGPSRRSPKVYWIHPERD